MTLLLKECWPTNGHNWENWNNWKNDEIFAKNVRLNPKFNG